MLGVMNLIARSTGLVLQPRRMWRAFVRGTQSRNLYRAATRAAVDAGQWPDLPVLRAHCLEVTERRGPRLLRMAEFGVYGVVAMCMHAAIAGPAVVARFITDITLGYSVFQAVKLKLRNDIY